MHRQGDQRFHRSVGTGKQEYNSHKVEERLSAKPASTIQVLGSQAKVFEILSGRAQELAMVEIAAKLGRNVEEKSDTSMLLTPKEGLLSAGPFFPSSFQSPNPSIRFEFTEEDSQSMGLELENLIPYQEDLHKQQEIQQEHQKWQQEQQQRLQRLQKQEMMIQKQEEEQQQEKEAESLSAEEEEVARLQSELHVQLLSQVNCCFCVTRHKLTDVKINQFTIL